MAIKLEVKDNFFIVTEANGNITNFQPQKLRFKIYSDTLHLISERYQDDLHFALADLVDSDGIAFASTAILNAWLLRSLGNTNKTDVVIQSNESPILMVKASNLIAETTMTSGVALNTYIINVASATGFTVGKYVTVYNAVANRVYFGNILAVNALAITLDTPLDFAFPSGSFVSVGSINMNVDGSVTKKIFGIRNPTGTDIPLKFDITRLMFSCLSTGVIDLSKFGDIVGGLTKGIVVRKVDGTYRNIFNAKTNAQLKNLMFDFDIQKASGNQQDGFTGRITFAGENKMGAVIRLEEQEDLQLIVQDNLSTLSSFIMIAQGSEVTD